MIWLLLFLLLCIVIWLISVGKDFLINLSENLNENGFFSGATIKAVASCGVVSLGTYLIYKFLNPIEMFKTISVWAAVIAVVIIMIKLIMGIYKK